MVFDEWNDVSIGELKFVENILFDDSFCVLYLHST